MLRPALVGPRYFYLIFVDQALPSAELRTVIFSFLYIPPLDCWPIERPLHGPWNSDWYHFSVICTAVYPPCVVFLSARYSKRCVVPRPQAYLRDLLDIRDMQKKDDDWILILPANPKKRCAPKKIDQPPEKRR